MCFKLFWKYGWVLLHIYFQVQPNNYASFYDDGRQNWSIAFEGEKILFEFAQKVCVRYWKHNTHFQCL